MRKEIVEIVGIETNGQWSRCVLSSENVAADVQKALSGNLPALTILPSPTNPNFRERTYQQVFIPLSVFKELQEEVIKQK